ncbi:MAG: thioredoxin-disulfide reductase [Cytophagales bacterium]|nr:thioredoxin-disulfide reductase [Cytophagales bacterium]
MERVQVLIIGSGPSGYTASIYVARAGLSPVLYKGSSPGGQLSFTGDVENYPGFPDGVQGPEMMQIFERQALRFGTQVREGTILEVDLSVHPFRVKAEEAELEAEAIIIGTGSSAKWLGLPSEQRLNGRGVSACAVCDGFFFKDQEVAVVGGGDTACEETFYLSRICKKVYMLVRRDVFRASVIMQDRVKKRDNIEILYETQVEEVLGQEQVEGLRLRRLREGKWVEENLSVSGLFVAIGHDPNTALFRGQLELDEAGYIKTSPDSSKTNIPGVFAIGDVRDSVYRQAITAAGTGCMGALDAERFLSSR